MRDNAIVGMINQAIQNLGRAFAGNMMNLAREVDELRAYVTAETVRRETLEEMLFEKSSLIGGINKEDYEKRYQAKIEDYNKKVQEQLEEAKKKAEEAAKGANAPQIVVPSAGGLVAPDGSPLAGSNG